jgi:hypothetical protein
MFPLSDGIPARRFPIVNILLIVANFGVFILYELPHLNAAVYHASFYPCSVDNACRAPEPWGLSWITAMFLHGGWDHILGNMLFLAIFGKNVEDAFGSLRYLLFYFAGGFAAMMMQTAMTLLFGTAQDALVPELGASRPGSSPSSYSGSRPGSSWAGGSSTSSSRRTSGCSTPTRTEAASRSSPTSAGSSSACWQHGSSPRRDKPHPGRNGAPRRSTAASSWPQEEGGCRRWRCESVSYQV